MFICECGGIMMVKNIEQYPDRLTQQEKLEYERKCIVECVTCKKVQENQKYD